jgi:ATP-dependent DNA helicase RecG
LILDIYDLNDFFKIVLSTQKSTQKDTQETVEKTVEKIIKLLKDNPQISQRELANITGLTQRGIEWNISKLKDSGQLERIGPDKGGHWKVLK